MTNFEINDFKKQILSCNLDKKSINERLKYLNAKLFSKAISSQQEGNKIIFIYPLERKQIDELVDLVFFEKNCCGNFSITMEFDLMKETLEICLKLID